MFNKYWSAWQRYWRSADPLKDALIYGGEVTMMWMGQQYFDLPPYLLVVGYLALVATINTRGFPSILRQDRLISESKARSIRKNGWRVSTALIAAILLFGYISNENNPNSQVVYIEEQTVDELARKIATIITPIQTTEPVVPPEFETYFIRPVEVEPLGDSKYAWVTEFGVRNRKALGFGVEIPFSQPVKNVEWWWDKPEELGSTDKHGSSPAIAVSSVVLVEDQFVALHYKCPTLSPSTSFYVYYESDLNVSIVEPVRFAELGDTASICQ